MSELKCISCEHRSFMQGNGNPSRHYCELANTSCEPRRMICRTERHETDMTIKRTPRWCPLNVT